MTHTAARLMQPKAFCRRQCTAVGILSLFTHLLGSRSPPVPFCGQLKEDCDRSKSQTNGRNNHWTDWSDVSWGISQRACITSRGQALTNSRHLDASIPVGGRRCPNTHTRLGRILGYCRLQGVLGNRVGFVLADQHTNLQSLLGSRRRASEGGNPGHRKEATRDKLGAASSWPVCPPR